MMNPVVLPQYSGDAGTFQALAIMRNQVNDSYLHPLIRERAAYLSQCGSTICATDHEIFTDFVKSNVKFIRDPFDTEILADPVTWIEERLRSNDLAFGDCAQMTPYLASLLKAIGHAPMFKVIGSNNYFSHVFLLCEGEELDPTLPNPPTDYERFIVLPI